MENRFRAVGREPPDRTAARGIAAAATFVSRAVEVSCRICGRTAEWNRAVASALEGIEHGFRPTFADFVDGAATGWLYSAAAGTAQLRRSVMIAMRRLQQAIGASCATFICAIGTPCELVQHVKCPIGREPEDRSASTAIAVVTGLPAEYGDAVKVAVAIQIQLPAWSGARITVEPVKDRFRAIGSKPEHGSTVA